MSGDCFYMNPETGKMENGLAAVGITEHENPDSCEKGWWSEMKEKMADKFDMDNMMMKDSA